MCPTSTVDIVSGWDFFESADYFNVCSSSTLFQVPENYFGYQNPPTGKGIVVFILMF